MRIFHRFLEYSPQFYGILAVWLIALIWVLSQALSLDMPDPLSQHECVVDLDNQATFFGVFQSQWFGTPWLIYTAFGDNVVGLMVLHGFLWSVAALLAIAAISKWRGKLSWWDMIVPILFLNPSTVQTLHEQWISNVVWIIYLLSLVVISRGHLKPWKLFTAFGIILLGTFSPGGLAVTIAALLFYGVHWIKTRWYTSAFLFFWTIIMGGLFVYFFGLELNDTLFSRLAAQPVDIVLYNWLKVFFGRWVYSAIFLAPLYLVFFVLSLLFVYWFVHPWIRPRKRPNRERDLLLIIGGVLLAFLYGLFSQNYTLGGFSTATLFALYWSSQIQRRWPKRTPRWVYLFLLIALIGSWIEYAYFINPAVVRESMVSLGFTHFVLS